MGERYGEPPKVLLQPKTIEAAVNLLSVIFAQVYFPTFSNGLKEIAGNLGFRWSDSDRNRDANHRLATRMGSIKRLLSKTALLTYNAEDCQLSRR